MGVACYGVPQGVGCHHHVTRAVMPAGATGLRGVPWAQGASEPTGCPRVLPTLPAAGWPFPCEVEAGVFEVPAGYTVLGAGRSEPLRDEDDDLLQFAIQQSLLDAGTETDQARPRPPSEPKPRPSRRGRPRPLLTQAPPTGDDLGGADQYPPGQRPAAL